MESSMMDENDVFLSSMLLSLPSIGRGGEERRGYQHISDDMTPLSGPREGSKGYATNPVFQKFYKLKRGDWVWVNTKEWKTATIRYSPYLGPFQILHKDHRSLSVTLDLPKNWIKHASNVISVRRIEFHQEGEISTESIDTRPEALSRRERLYTVEHLLGRRDTYRMRRVDGEETYKLMRTDYLVKWKGYPMKEASWEIDQNIGDPALIIAFENQPYPIPFRTR